MQKKKISFASEIPAKPISNNLFTLIAETLMQLM